MNTDKKLSDDWADRSKGLGADRFVVTFPELTDEVRARIENQHPDNAPQVSPG